jgi:hypothetical protein
MNLPSILFAAILFAFSIGNGIAQQSGENLPNILWISCEDLSPHFEFYGDNSVTTPNYRDYHVKALRMIMYLQLPAYVLQVVVL